MTHSFTSSRASSTRGTAAGLLMILTPAAMIASLIAAGPAAAARVQQDVEGPAWVAIGYADLDLSGPAGARTMLGRIRTASGRVCHAAAPATPVNLGGVRSYRACVGAAIDRAVLNLDAPVVTALYANQFPERPAPPN